MDYFTPSIGQAGVYRVAAPFDKILKPNVSYTCRSIRSITECLENGESTYSSVYEPNGLTREEFNADSAAGVSIVTLQAGAGIWAYIPNKYFTQTPENNGVYYHEVVMGVGLGPVPCDMDLSTYQDMVSDLIYNTFGRRPAIRFSQATLPTLISHDKHETIQAMRIGKASQFKSNLRKVEELDEKLKQANETIKRLSGIIIERLGTSV